jgi:hypothetical protein
MSLFWHPVSRSKAFLLPDPKLNLPFEKRRDRDQCFRVLSGDSSTTEPHCGFHVKLYEQKLNSLAGNTLKRVSVKQISIEENIKLITLNYIHSFQQ